MVISWCVGTTCLIGPLVIQTYRLRQNHLPRYHKIFTQFCWIHTVGKTDSGTVFSVWLGRKFAGLVPGRQFRVQWTFTTLTHAHCEEWLCTELELLVYVLQMCKKSMLEISLTWRKDILKELSYLVACQTASLWPIRHCFTRGDEKNITNGWVKVSNVQQETLNLTHSVFSLYIQRYQNVILFWHWVEV